MQIRLGPVVCMALALAGAAGAHAQPAARTLRVAYLTHFPSPEAQQRLDAVATRVEARWPRAARPDTAIGYRAFRYEPPPSGSRMDAEQRGREEARREAANRATVEALLAWKPDVIYAPGALAAREAARHTARVPVVFACKCNPFPDGWGLVRDPARPERNLTGFTRYHLGMLGTDAAQRLNLQRKRIEVLKLASASPVRRVGAIHGNDYDERKWRYAEAARALGVEWVPLRVDAGSIESLPALLARERIDAAMVLADDFADLYRERLVKATAAAAMPVLFPWDEADLGAWMHYGTVVDIADKSAEYLVNILQGRPVSEYPVEFPKRMELAINLRTARRHGWEYPRAFLLQVDRVVE